MSSFKHFNTILSPVITEKSTLGSEHNQVTFRVPVTATKPLASSQDRITSMSVNAVRFTVRSVIS